MNPLSSVLQSHPLIYITRDIERALGLPINTPGYFIISNSSPFAKRLSIGHDNILLIESQKQLDTIELMQQDKVKKWINEKIVQTTKTGGHASIVVFKNTKHIEALCTKNIWPLVNPNAGLSQTIEEKISQISWLGELASYLPPHHVAVAEDITWQDAPFIVQWNHAHSGGGTMHISSAGDLQAVQKKFPKRQARIATYIHGPVFTNNTIVASDVTLIGNINYQITGLAPFTDIPFATVGNDWGLTKTILSPGQESAYYTMVEAIGNRLRQDGWRGLFGVDVIVDKVTEQLYLLEINARQPAGTTFESVLQENTRTDEHKNTKTQKHKNNELTVFEAHLAALLNVPLRECSLIEITDGAQLVVRNQQVNTIADLSLVKEQLEKMGYTVMTYDNTHPGTERLRIQSHHSFMKAPMECNEEGQGIQTLLR